MAEFLAAEFASLALIVFLAFCTSVLGGLSGVGGVMLVSPFLLPLVGVKGVVPVIAIAMLLGNFARVWVYRSAIEPTFLIWLVISVVPGVVLGTLIYERLPTDAVAIAIGLFMIASVPLRRALKGKPLQLGPAAVSGVGFGFGVITGATPGFGIIILSVLLGMGLTGPALIGTDGVVGVVSNVVKIAMFGGLDLLDAKIMVVGLMIGIAMVPGAYVARALMTRMPMHVHVALMEAFVIIAGVSFLWQAFAG